MAGAARAAAARPGGRATADGVDGAAQRRVEAETREAGQQGGHKSPAGGAARAPGAGARLVGAVAFVAGVVLEAVVEHAAHAADARRRVDHEARATQRLSLIHI